MKGIRSIRVPKIKEDADRFFRVEAPAFTAGVSEAKTE
jgi:hypothetical protein